MEEKLSGLFQPLNSGLALSTQIYTEVGENTQIFDLYHMEQQRVPQSTSWGHCSAPQNTSGHLAAFQWTSTTVCRPCFAQQMHPTGWRGTPDGMAAGSATPQTQLRHLLQQKTFPPLCEPFGHTEPQTSSSSSSSSPSSLLLSPPHQHISVTAATTQGHQTLPRLPCGGQGGTYLPHQCLWGLHLCPPSHLVAKALHTMHSQKNLSGML